MLNKDAGKPWPWIADPILQQFRFCNVFREDDRTTKWIREHITFERYGSRILGAMIIARWFNRIETLELMLPPKNCGKKAHCALLDDLFWCWADTMDGWEATMQEVLKNQSPLVTGAYMIKSPAKMNKLTGLIWCLKQILPDAVHLQVNIEPGETTLEGVTDALKQYPFLGPFMSYEVVTDLRHSVLSTAPDIMTWANPGPGACRGIGRVWYDCPKALSLGSEKDRAFMQQCMRDLLKYSQHQLFWPAEWPKWEMRDVEHTLCEFDKYERVRLGEGRPKQKYKRLE